MRELLGKYGYFVVGILLATAACLLWWNLRSNPTMPQITRDYYLDEETNEVSIHNPMTDFPPLLNSKGNRTIVLAPRAKFGKDIKTLYLCKYSDQMQKVLIERMGRVPMAEADSFYRSPEPGSQWYPFGSPEAQALLNQKCADGPDPVRVYP